MEDEEKVNDTTDKEEEETDNNKSKSSPTNKAKYPNTVGCLY
jgi:hypothetical protein